MPTARWCWSSKAPSLPIRRNQSPQTASSRLPLRLRIRYGFAAFFSAFPDEAI
jgi:hypothetical protein